MKRFPLLILAFLALTVMAARKPQTDVAKSDYLFLEAQKAIAINHHDAAYDLLTRALELNPGDPDIEGRLARYAINLAKDSIQLQQAVEMLRAYCDNNPTDITAWWDLAAFTANNFGINKSLPLWEKMHELFPERDEVTEQLARIYGMDSSFVSFSKATRLFKELQERQGRNVGLTSSLNELYLNRGDTASVLRATQELLEASPRNVDNNIYAGHVYSYFKMPQAIDYFNKAVELEPSNGLAVYSRADYYQSQGDSARYDQEIFRALEMEDLDTNTKLGILKNYVQEIYGDSTRRPQIRAMFNRLCEVHPHEHDIRLIHGTYLIALEEYADAAEQISLALDVQPDEPKEWELLTSLYFQQDDNQKALNAAQSGLKYFPDNPQLHLMVSGAYNALGRTDLALSYARKALEVVDSTDMDALSSVYVALGDSYSRSQKQDSAMYFYDHALLYRPDDIMLMNNVAYFLADKGGDLDRALSLIEKAVANDDDSADNRATRLDTYAWVLFKRKDYQKARQVMDQAIELYSKPSEEIWEHAGDIYFMDGEPDKAVDFWKKALDLAPGNELLKKKVKNKTYFYKL